MHVMVHLCFIIEYFEHMFKPLIIGEFLRLHISIISLVISLIIFIASR